MTHFCTISQGIPCPICMSADQPDEAPLHFSNCTIFDERGIKIPDGKCNCGGAVEDKNAPVWRESWERDYQELKNNMQALEEKYAHVLKRESSIETDIDFKLSKAAEDVFMERKRQVMVEGWTPEHDDLHIVSDLATAGACYALAGLEHYIDEQEVAKAIWPWDKSWWKPKDNRRNLVRGAALIIAEIERLDRRKALTKTTSIEGLKP